MPETAASAMSRRRLMTAAAAWPLAATAAPAAASARLQGLLRERLAHQGVGLAAAELDHDRIDLATAGPPGADDLFEIGSLTKTFTALLLAEMVVRRDLALDDPVEAAFGAGLRLRDSAGAPIRYVDLATHRSGLPRLATNMVPRSSADPYADYGAEALRAFLAEWRAERPRDTQWLYSNLGYGLLGEALARHAGRDFDTLLRERVLQPLGLTGMSLSLARPGRADPPRRLPGHDTGGQPVPGWHFQTMAGAGALLGSVRHLARYAQAALALIDTPLAPAFALALAARADGPSPANRIGLAWLHGPLNDRQVMQHDGGTFGFASSLWLDPTRRRASVVLSNAALPVTDLALHVLDPSAPLRDLAAEARSTGAEAVALAAEQLAPLAGRYALNPQFQVAVRAEGTRLFAQATGQGEFELFAKGPREFFARVTPLAIRFDGEAGAPAAFELTQGGRTMRFVRQP